MRSPARGRHGPRSAPLRSPFYFLLSDLAVFRGSIEVAPFAFEKLIVCQKAAVFADAARTLTKGFPRGCFFLADQLNRAALSIATSLAEVDGRVTKPKEIFGT